MLSRLAVRYIGAQFRTTANTRLLSIWSSRAKMPEAQCSEAKFKRFGEIIKPKEDKRQYLGLELPNKLKVLLISDAETDISAASLSVHVGSMSDPWDLQGLFHFLEHMLFMGTKKYPSENEYSKFLSQHGGSSNAYTSDSVTNFFFDVAPEFFVPSLDRFAQFFIEPLMLEGSVGRELEAVNSEYCKNLKLDEWRMCQLNKLLGDKTHDYYKFNIGNYETLRDIPTKKGIDIREALFEYYNKHYSANLMCLCVLGKESIDELLDMVTGLFSPIVNKDLKAPSWEVHPYGKDSLMKQVYVVPVKDKRTIDYVFVYPDETAHFKAAPGHYLSHLIGYEGKGSLLSELKARGLGSSLVSYYTCNDGFGFFHITVDLTSDALNRLDEISLLVFQYINLLKMEGPKKYIFDENKGLSYIKFNFMEKINPIDYVQKLSYQMHMFPLENVISSDLLVEEYKPDLISEMLSYLKPENCSIFIMSKTFDGQTDSTEKYYGTEYKIDDFSQTLVDQLKNPGLNDQLKFPEPNEFIPTNFDILPIGDASNNEPRIIKSSDFSRIWHLKDDQYLKPKVYYALKIINPIVHANPHYANINTMFAILFKDALNEFLYDAKLAGLSFDIFNTNYGINIEFYGYNHKMDIFMQRVFEKIITYEPCPRRFEILKEKYARSLKNYKAQPLYQLTGYYLKLLTCEYFWAFEDLQQALDKLTVESVRHFQHFFFSNCFTEALFHGNVSSDSALALCDFIENKFLAHYNAIPLKKWHGTTRGIALEPGCNYTFEVTNDLQQPKAINVYFQVSFDDLDDSAKLLFIGQMLSEPFFDILRTKEQLGYVTYCRYREQNGVLGFNCIIQSDYNVAYLDDRIEAFMAWVENHIESMSEDEYNNEKQSLISRLMKKKKRLVEYSRLLWSEIEKEEYLYGRNEVIASIVKTLSKECCLSFFKKHFSLDSPARKKLSVRIVKSDLAQNDNLPTSPANTDLLPAPPRKIGTPVENIETFSKHKSLYPLPKPKIMTT